MGSAKLGTCLLLAAYLVGCGAGGDSKDFTGNSGGDASLDGGGGASGEAGSSGASGSAGVDGGEGGSSGSPIGDSGSEDVGFQYDSPSQDGPLDACVTATAEAEPVPLDMYVILDTSGSMHRPQAEIFRAGDCDIGQVVDSKWCRAIHALYGFFAAPSSVGIGVALGFFGGDDCSPVSSPAVPLQSLPPGLPALQNALNGENPVGGTPTEAAALGITAYTGPNQQPGRTMIGIIITDGDPTSCNTSTSHINDILADHFNATAIPTFIVGMEGATFSRLETMAQGAGADPHTAYCGGGISPCHFFNVGWGDPQALIAVLQAIQLSAVGCSFNMPVPAVGVVDPDQVEVEVMPGGGGAPQTIPRVDNFFVCGSGDGWYYDDNTNPTTINLCPTTCDTVVADPGAKIEIVLGCLGS